MAWSYMAIFVYWLDAISKCFVKYFQFPKYMPILFHCVAELTFDLLVRYLQIFDRIV